MWWWWWWWGGGGGSLTHHIQHKDGNQQIRHGRHGQQIDGSIRLEIKIYFSTWGPKKSAHAFGPNVLDLQTLLFFSHWLFRLCICLYWSINIEYWRDGVGEGISYLFFSEVVPKISLLSQFDCTEWTKWLIWVWFWSLRPLSPPTTSGSVVSFLNKLSNHLFVTFISVWHSCPNIGITHHFIVVLQKTSLLLPSSTRSSKQ